MFERIGLDFKTATASICIELCHINPSRLSYQYIGRGRFRQIVPTTRQCYRYSRSQPSHHAPGRRCRCLNLRIRP